MDMTESKPGSDLRQVDDGNRESKEEDGSVVKREEKFSFLSICGIAVTTGESWIVLGNSLVRQSGSLEDRDCANESRRSPSTMAGQQRCYTGCMCSFLPSIELES